MVMMTKYFYDSYAIIEYLKDNPKFYFYFEESEGVTTLCNVMEVYYSVLKEFGINKAKLALDVLRTFLINFDFKDIESSMNFRFKNKNKKFSYTDCLGYTIAKKLNIKFLTGDQGFKDLPNVEFIKAKE